MKTPSLSIQPGSLIFKSPVGTQTLAVAMKGNSWVAYSDKAWCSLSQTASNSASTNIDVSVTPNTTREKRLASIKFLVNEIESVSVGVQQEVGGVFSPYSSWVNGMLPYMSSFRFAPIHIFLNEI